jgi:hypothetical protein
MQPEPRHAREDGLRHLLTWSIHRPSPVMSNVSSCVAMTDLLGTCDSVTLWSIQSTDWLTRLQNDGRITGEWSRIDLDWEHAYR